MDGIEEHGYETDSEDRIEELKKEMEGRIAKLEAKLDEEHRIRLLEADQHGEIQAMNTAIDAARFKP